MKRLAVLLLGASVAACEGEQPPASISAPAQPPQAVPLRQQGAAPVQGAIPARSNDMAQLARGGTLFQKHCATCHGAEAQGAPDWSKQGPDGKWPAPPLNGTGHAWHHPLAALTTTIKQGTQRIGGNMPAWQEKLTDQEIADIIAWFQARWPQELYEAWYDADQRARSSDSGSSGQ